MLRLGILPTGWIYSKEKRAIRDLLRRRSQLVRQKTANRLGLRNVLEHSGAKRLSGNALKRISENDPSDSATWGPSYTLTPADGWCVIPACAREPVASDVSARHSSRSSACGGCLATRRDSGACSHTTASPSTSRSSRSSTPTVCWMRRPERATGLRGSPRSTQRDCGIRHIEIDL